MAALRLWWDTIRGIVTTAPREHLDLLTTATSATRCAACAGNPGSPSSPSWRSPSGSARTPRSSASSNGVLIQALPYEEPDSLVDDLREDPGAPVDKFHFSAPDFEIVRERDPVVLRDGRLSQRDLRAVGHSRAASGSSARACRRSCSTVLGVSPAIGRALTAEDDRREREGRGPRRTASGRARSDAIRRSSAGRSSSIASLTPSSA